MTHVAIASAQVDADLTDFVVLVDLADLPSSFWSVVANGGGDIRVFKSDGTTELAREVVSCDTATDTGELWVKFSGVLSGTSDTTIQIHADGSSSEPAFTATYGRNAVWSEYLFSLHLRDGATIENSAGDSTWDITTAGSGVSQSALSPWGGSTSVDFDGTATGFMEIAAGSTVGGTNDPLTFSAWIRADVIKNDEVGIFTAQTGSSDSLFVFFDNYNFVGGSSDAIVLQGRTTLERPDTGNFSFTDANTWRYFTGAGERFNDLDLYLDSTLEATAEFSQGWDTDAASYGIGQSESYVSSNWDGQIAEVRFRQARSTSSWVSTEYNNQSSPSTFYTASAVAAPTAVEAPSPLQQLSNQFSTIAASRLNGVLQ